MSKKSSSLTPELDAAFVHFLQCHPPKHFSRNLRNVMIEVVIHQNGNYPDYINELLISMEMFFDVLDIAEDTGLFDDPATKGRS
ncbi:MAG: hypothetical protein ABIS36_11965 [Chryseolinea sp.]